MLQEWYPTGTPVMYREGGNPVTHVASVVSQTYMMQSNATTSHLLLRPHDYADTGLQAADAQSWPCRASHIQHNQASSCRTWGVSVVMLLCRGVAQHCVRAVAERGMTPDDLLQKLQAAGVEASPSQALPHHFIKTAGLQMLLTQGLLQQGLCQVLSLP